MNFELYVIPIAIVVVIGALAALVLTIASKFMAVEVNQRTTELRNALPGANCGACGYPGCDQYANVLNEDETVALNLCTPGGEKTIALISDILGRKAEALQPMIAVVKCSGTFDKTEYVMDYYGMQSCSANKLFYRGRGACPDVCLGYGDCVRACPFDAIVLEKGIARVNEQKCVGCKVCVATCPSKLIKMVPTDKCVVVGCSNQDKGSWTNKICKIGCIACKLCEKDCPSDAIKVVDNLAEIDYNKCTNCMACIEACPKKVIRKLWQ